MSVSDRAKRKRAAEEKNTKLRSPNFSVSRTRLSVRNLPFTMQEKELKQLFIAAVRLSGLIVFSFLPLTCTPVKMVLVFLFTHFIKRYTKAFNAYSVIYPLPMKPAHVTFK